MALMLESAWRVSVLDIESTLSRVCDKVLLDAGVSPAQRKRRALALQCLGHVFSAHGAPDDHIDFAAQLQRAIRQVAECASVRARERD